MKFTDTVTGRVYEGPRPWTPEWLDSLSQEQLVQLLKETHEDLDTIAKRVTEALTDGNIEEAGLQRSYMSTYLNHEEAILKRLESFRNGPVSF